MTVQTDEWHVQVQSIVGQTVCACGWKPPLGVSAWRAVDRHIREMGEQE